jgi:hypothetical protein
VSISIVLGKVAEKVVLVDTSIRFLLTSLLNSFLRNID